MRPDSSGSGLSPYTRSVRINIHVALQEQDAFGQLLHVQHLLDGCALVEVGEQIEALIVAVEVPEHVLVDGGEFVADGFVQQIDTLLVHEIAPPLSDHGRAMVQADVLTDSSAG